MKYIRLLFLSAFFILSASACVGISTPLATEIRSTSTETSAPTSTAAPSFTPKPTNTPRATSTPKPVAVVVTSRPTGNPNPVQITGPIGQDYKNLGIPQSLWFERVAWVADIRMEYRGGNILLSGSSNGVKPLVVDDVLTLKILHENGRFDTFEYDFSATSTSTGPQEAGPFDLTPFFHEGVNMLYVTIYDYGYSYWGTPGLWLVEFR